VRYLYVLNFSSISYDSTVGIPDYQLSLLRHLLIKENVDAGCNNASTKPSIRGACATVLSLQVEDVEEHIPLSSYGLDSLTSVRLSSVLKQHFGFIVTQLQLLGGHMTGQLSIFIFMQMWTRHNLLNNS
jgi:fatty acid synthase